MAVEIDLPFGVDATGGIRTVTDPGRIVQNHVFCAAGTQKGERVMSPEYGANLLEHVFEAINESELESLQEDISEAVLAYVPEAEVTGVDVSQDRTNGIVSVLVHFTATNSDTEQTVILPTPLSTA